MRNIPEDGKDTTERKMSSKASVRNGEAAFEIK